MDRNNPPNPTHIGQASFDAEKDPPDDQIQADLDWLNYLGKLPPEDAGGAFLLSSELPNEDTPPRQILAAIMRATRRAFQPSSPLEFTDYELGRIWGTMRVLLPQGREIQERFNGERGWKATAILGERYETRPVTVYYRQRCMNPVRVISRSEAVVDTSDVTFVPDGQDVPQYITASPDLAALFAAGIDALIEQYQALRTARSRTGFQELIIRYFRFRR